MYTIGDLAKILGKKRTTVYYAIMSCGLRKHGYGLDDLKTLQNYYAAKAARRREIEMAKLNQG